ncbi:YwqG family protein [Streptomyces sp. NBC_01077]|uniref:hypothetical protein n=1 Tax=Streptomyces sp. NBC_01077 TaxID=2903746 RepID=UPI00386AA2D1|nr:YwqG family protein [Streptomyces sp. NBC_01077]
MHTGLCDVLGECEASVPGLRLAYAGDGPVAGQLCGLPELPLDQPWLEWERHGALSHIASLDCAALATDGGCGLALLRLRNPALPPSFALQAPQRLGGFALHQG